MRQMLAALYNNRNVPDIIYENETLRTRKSFPHSRRSQPTAAMNLHYGTIHHQPANSSLDEQEEEPLHIVETPSTTSTADIASVTAQQTRATSEMRNSFSSSDGGSINGGNVINKVGPIMSPPNFALVSSPADEIKRKKDKSLKKHSSDEGDNVVVDNNGPVVANITPQDLRRELKEAVAARKDADERIIAWV